MTKQENEILSIIMKLDDLERSIKVIQSDMNDLRYDLRDTKLTLENETNRNIKLIAEGHLDLTRKFDEALKVENEKEMLLVRVNIIENELRKVKEQMEQIA